MHAHIHPTQIRFTSPLASGSVDHRLRALCPWVVSSCKTITVPRVPLPVNRCYLFSAWDSTHVGRHYPTFLARTDSCARPHSSRILSFHFVLQVFAGCCVLPTGISPFPALSPRIFLSVLRPLPRLLLWCIIPFLPTRLRPSRRTEPVSATDILSTATSVEVRFSGLQSFDHL